MTMHKLKGRIEESENYHKTREVPFASFSYNGAAHWKYLSPRLDIYFQISLLKEIYSYIYKYIQVYIYI